MLDCQHELLVSLRTQHQLVFPPQYEDGPTWLRTFLNLQGASGVASFVSAWPFSLAFFWLLFWSGYRLSPSFRLYAPRGIYSDVILPHLSASSISILLQRLSKNHSPSSCPKNCCLISYFCHYMASVLLVQALQKGQCGANQIAYTDIGSAENLAEQDLDLKNTANKTMPY